jgi:hypothetical protein
MLELRSWGDGKRKKAHSSSIFMSQGYVFCTPSIKFTTLLVESFNKRCNSSQDFPITPTSKCWEYQEEA